MTILALVAGSGLAGAVHVRATASLPSPQPIGTTISIAAAATSTSGGVLSYRFELLSPGVSSYRLLRDYSTASTFAWTPTDREGGYRIRVTARDYTAGESARAVVYFQISPVVGAGQTVVRSTANPLVALFSAPACSPGSSMRVAYGVTGSNVVNRTPWKACQAGVTMNFLAAGMYAGSTYTFTNELTTGAAILAGPASVSFRTGPLPALPFPTMTSLVPVTGSTSTADRYLLLGFTKGTPFDTVLFPVAYDLRGSVIWYYPVLGAELKRPESGGSVFLTAPGAGTGTGINGGTSVGLLREVDLAGNTLRETNPDRVSEQLVALGTDPINRFHHEILRLPNGHLITFGDPQRAFPTGTQGAAGPVDVIGFVIIELDANLQVVSYWNAFDHDGPDELDINRAARLGDTCAAGAYGCPGALLPGFNVANDWLHGNSLQYLAADGSFVVSFRNQDWVIKVDYGNGAGSGRVLWRLGQDGDFMLQGATDAKPWFSGQHDAAFDAADPRAISLFDNGNSRRAADPMAHSRGQVLLVDEGARSASIATSADLGVYSPALGSAQTLSNGNPMFFNGVIATGGIPVSRETEVSPSGEIVHSLQFDHSSYRSFRMKDLYTPPTGQ